eukprot:830542-Prymnesium_polylepis.1
MGGGPAFAFLAPSAQPQTQPQPLPPPPPAAFFFSFFSSFSFAFFSFSFLLADFSSVFGFSFLTSLEPLAAGVAGGSRAPSTGATGRAPSAA